MKVVEHIEMETMNPLLDASSKDYGYDHHQLEQNVLQERYQRQVASTNMDIENCIIKRTNTQDITGNE